MENPQLALFSCTDMLPLSQMPRPNTPTYKRFTTGRKGPQCCILVQVTRYCRLRSGQDGHLDHWSRWPSRPIRSLRYILSCTRIRPRVRHSYGSLGPIPANTKHLYNMCTLTAQRLRRWPNIVHMVYKCFVLVD